MAEEKKKLTFQEIAKQRLAEKKAQQAGGTFSKGPVKSTKQLKNQQTKKANNQARRTGV
ncbi:hypothetical protein KUV80_12560 [Fictibacillus nanhaiensis]|uniref:hypothetical protein n=1 Tax=Fictibacillus nanhaiensis TaxID=742169 RepID=UPI001C953A64|nr:hypothetical protein [Fictibacillus nanhaiensis]MBY6037498.1 hypothetical protein [Fictibacillus nanhaiensis]